MITIPVAKFYTLDMDRFYCMCDWVDQHKATWIIDGPQRPGVPHSVMFNNEADAVVFRLLFL
jgi:hypothetical protein